MPSDSALSTACIYFGWRGFQLPTPSIHITELQFNGIESSTMALKLADFFNLLQCSQNAWCWYRCIPSSVFLFCSLINETKYYSERLWQLSECSTCDHWSVECLVCFTNSDVPAAASCSIVNQVPTCIPSESSDRVRCWVKRKFCCWHGEGKIIWLPCLALKNRCTWNDRMFCLPLEYAFLFPIHVLHLSESCT